MPACTCPVTPSPFSSPVQFYHSCLVYLLLLATHPQRRPVIPRLLSAQLWHVSRIFTPSLPAFVQVCFSVLSVLSFLLQRQAVTPPRAPVWSRAPLPLIFVVKSKARLGNGYLPKLTTLFLHPPSQKRKNLSTHKKTLETRRGIWALLPFQRYLPVFGYLSLLSTCPKLKTELYSSPIPHTIYHQVRQQSQSFILPVRYACQKMPSDVGIHPFLIYKTDRWPPRSDGRPFFLQVTPTPANGKRCSFLEILLIPSSQPGY